jgi:hypothetical protein
MSCVKFPTNYKQVPVSTSIILLLTIIFLVYSFYKFPKPCGNDIKSIFISNFVTIDIGQLIVILYSLYSLSELELQIGSQLYLKLVLMSLAINTTLEWMIHKYNSKLPCSLGFNGIVLSLVIISLIFGNRVSFKIMIPIVILATYISLQHKSQYLGHVVGTITGTIISLILKK